MHTARFLTAAACILSLLPGCADEPPAVPALPSPPAALEQATHFFDIGRYDSAALFFDRARLAADSLEDWESAVHLRNRLSESAWRGGDYETSRTAAREALDLAALHFGPDHPERATSYRHLGTASAITGFHDEAIAFWQQAIDIAAAVHGPEHESVLKIQNNLASLYAERGEYERSKEIHANILALRLATLGEFNLSVAISYQNLGNAYLHLEEYDKALRMQNKALGLHTSILGPRHPLVGENHVNIGLLYHSIGHFRLAIQHFNEAARIWTKTLPANHPRWGILYNSLGLSYMVARDIPRAIFHYNLSADIVKLNNLHSSNLFKGLSLNIAEAHYANGNFSKSIDYLSSLADLHALVLSPRLRLITYSKLAKSHALNGDHHSAEYYAILSIKLYHNIDNKESANIASAYSDASYALHLVGESQLAINKLKHLFDDSNNPIHIRSRILLGHIYADFGLPEQALDVFLSIVHSNKESTHLLHTSSPEFRHRLAGLTTINQVWKPMANIEAASIYYKLFTQHNDPRHLLEAEKFYTDAFLNLNRNIRYYNNPHFDYSYLSMSAEPLKYSVPTSYRIFHLSGLLEDANRSFKWAEATRGIILSESLSEVRARQYAGLPDSLVELEEQLRVDRTFYEQRIQLAEADPGSVDSSKRVLWQDKMFALREDYDSLQAHLEREYPAYYDLKYQTKTASISEVQDELLDERSALIEYALATDSIYAFVIRKDDFDIAVLPRDSLLESEIDLFRNSISQWNDTLYIRTGASLYEQLFEPLEPLLEGAERLLIVPDDHLVYLPFEALLAKRVDDITSFQKLPYLLNDYEISYAYSATLLLQTRRRQSAQPPPNDFIAFAPVFEDGVPAYVRGDDQLDEWLPPSPLADSLFSANAALDPARSRAWNSDGSLPATRDEVRGIAGMFKERYGLFERLFSPRARVLLENKATETQLKAADLASYRFVHLATHGFVNEDVPDLSGLVLAPSEGEDGVLRLGEVYNLNLGADLVVLSSCETGLGQLAKGEGIIGLTRGFLYAGAQNVVVSLWKVEDSGTAQLMQHFYTSMLQGEARPKALRSAKLALIERGELTARPFFWAPFVLIGD